MRRRLLIVSPVFPPANGADSHRVRTTLPFFRKHGWDPEVLTVDPECLAVPQDPWLLEGIPKDIPVHRCDALSLRWSKVPGLGAIGPRARFSMRRLGGEVLASRRFDMVYFSTTTFSLLALGSYWKRRFGVPFVIDYQDPWITDYYREHPNVVPPGGRLKYWIVEQLARRSEPRVIRSCSGITAVSAAYPTQLQSRYSFARVLPCCILPFPGAQRDFDRLATDGLRQSQFDANDGLEHWLYVGVSGPIMYKAIGALFGAINIWRNREPAKVARIRMHFVGTSYAPAGTGVPVVLPLAERHGVLDLVTEQTDRVGYSEALCCLRDADVLLALGSDDASYNASKLLPYILARRPMLAVFHRQSPASELLEQIGGSTLLTFESSDSEESIAVRIDAIWCKSEESRSAVPIVNEAISSYTDEGQAKILCDYFEGLLNAANDHTVTDADESLSRNQEVSSQNVLRNAE
jgi:hypothetical protein